MDTKRTHEHKISNLVPTQLPEFVQDQHPLFSSFLKAYYEWMEFADGNAAINEAEGPVESIGSIDDDRDVDKTLGRYVEYFRREYLESIPSDVLVNRALLVKHIKEYYRTKGTEQSIKFLFRILYNEDVTIYYPNRDLLRTSDGKWVSDKSILVNTDITALESTVVTTPTGSALIETVTPFNTKHSGVYYKVVLNTSSIKGTFSAGQTLTGTDSTGAVMTATVKARIIDPTITNGGSGYRKGDTFYLREGTTNQDIITYGVVKTISTTGAILSVKLATYELNEVAFGTVTVDFSNTGGTNAAGAAATTNTGCLVTENGRYLNEDGQPSSNKRLQDNYYWQDYSYELQSTVAIDSYFDLLQKAVHPAGMIAFAKVLGSETSSQTTVDVGLNAASWVKYIIEIATQKVTSVVSVQAKMVLNNLQVQLNQFTTTYGNMRLTDFHGWMTRPIDSNPYYPKLLYATPDTLITPARRLEGLAAYTPGSLITIT